MDERIRVLAPAKINLALDIIAKRPDGYHDLRMIMQSVSLYDELTITLTDTGRFTAESTLPFLPSDERNLSLRAAKLYLKKTGRDGLGCRIHIKKRIPVCAGLGGGSSDAAAALRALNEYYSCEVNDETLAMWALEIGSDVPYCLLGSSRLAEGRGEILTVLPAIPECFILLCTPPVSVSTAETFSSLNIREITRKPDWTGLLAAFKDNSLTGIARRMYNVLEERNSLRVLHEIRAVMTAHGALGVVMSGTGPTMLGVFEHKNEADNAYAELFPIYKNTFVTQAL